MDMLRRTQRRWLAAPRKTQRLARVPTQWMIDGVDEPPRLLPHEAAVSKRLFDAPSQLITSTADEDDLPEWDVPEVAFAGRSNVGKSSLINAITSQPQLVRTSKTPGRTQRLNFFSVGGKKGSQPDLALVDMPGYGFATAPKAVVDEWHQLVGNYIDQRRATNLKTTYILIDSRRGVQKMDEEFMDYLFDLGTLYQIIFTKADSVSPDALTKTVRKAQDMAKQPERINMHPIIHVCSSRLDFGIQELRHQLVSISGLLHPK